MGELHFLDKIIADAKAEAKKITKEATTLWQSNVDYAKKESERVVAEAHLAAKETSAVDTARANARTEIETKKQLLLRKTEIVDQLFDSVKAKLAFPEKIIEKPNFRIRITVDELLDSLREEIEPEVVKILWT